MELVILPDEVLSLICQELGNQRDFNTLYGCAQSAKSLADAALRMMYQYHEYSPAFIQSDDAEARQRGATFEEKQKSQEAFFRSWTVLWRSIIASSVENSKTYKPYCRYLRILDFRNLATMLEDLGRVGYQHIKRSFFAAPLSMFNHTKQEFNRSVVDVIPTLNHIGETLVPKASLLEEITGPLRPGYLARWAAQSPRLQHLVVAYGDALDQEAGQAIAEHCEHFRDLTIQLWTNENADEVFAQFLGELNRDTLQYFEMISRNALANRSFESLGRHTSLRELRLGSLSKEAMEVLNSLKDCTGIRTLHLEDGTKSVQLEARNNDVFVEVVHWLSSCTELRDISLKDLWDGPSILAQVAVAPEVRWTKLHLEGSGYSIRNPNAAAFHTALAEQSKLETLLLKGSGEDSTPDDLSIMVSAISSLTNLKDLALRDISDEFEETHIINLALSLPWLEDFWTSGLEVSADVLPVLANLQLLKSLNLLAITQFTLDNILEFLGRLDPERQKGFSLNLMAVDQEYILSPEEQAVVQQYIAANLDGRFESVPWREAESSGSDDD